jgi:hypothetical protein
MRVMEELGIRRSAKGKDAPTHNPVIHHLANKYGVWS